MRTLISPLALVVMLSCSAPGAKAGQPAAEPIEAGQAEAIFAGGCFWCMEKPFDAVPGVISTTSGYTGGKEKNPTYEDVGYHRTSHVEALRVIYDPTKTDYETLLGVFWHNIDPTQDNGQFCDKGDQYRSALFPMNAEEKSAAKKSLKAVEKELGQKVVTTIREPSTFWVAEEYHQDFYKKEPIHYGKYRAGCGRDRRLKEVWGEKAGH